MGSHSRYIRIMQGIRELNHIIGIIRKYRNFTNQPNYI